MMVRIHRRIAVSGAALAMIAGSAAVVAPRVVAATPQSLLHFGGTVTVSQLPSSRHANASTAQPPSHTMRRSGTHAQASASTISGPQPPMVQERSTTAGPRALSSPVVVEQLQSFGGISADEQVADFGAPEQGVTPPDTQVAAGPDSIVEPTNSSLLIMGHHGESRHLVDQYMFWSSVIPTGYNISDPKIAYDAATGHFYFSTLTFGASSQASFVLLAVSDTTDPTSTWHLYSLPSSSPAHTLLDQPLLGFDDNVLVLSWNAFDNSAPNPCGSPNNVGVLVVDKGDLDALSATPATHAVQTFNGVQSLVPAISQTSTSTEYLVYNREDLDCTNNNPNYLTWSQVGVISITGRPNSGGTDTTSFTSIPEQDINIHDSNGSTVTVGAPAPASQPNNMSHTLDTSDGRMQSVVFDNGRLFTAGSVAIFPDAQNPNFTVSALLTERIDPSGPAMDDTVLYSTTNNLFDPATVVDGNGISFYSFTRSGTSRYASSGAFAYDWTGAGNLLSAGVIGSGIGNGDYACGQTVPPCELGGTNSGIERWGDYSGIAVDPGNGNDVWAASEFAPSAGQNWGTAISRLTVSQPVVTGISVSSGRTTGGTSLTITGNEFDPATATGWFGGTAAQSVQRLDPEHIAVVTPPHSPGGFGVQVSAADGTSPVGAVFTFVEPPLRHGYWFVATDGGIFAEHAPFDGSEGSTPLNKPIVGMAATPDGGGYWLVASDGGIFTHGNAKFLGSTGAIRLNQPIVGMSATPDGLGYWLVATDGGIFAFGDAHFLGSTGATHLNKPIVGMAPTATGLGYWLVASDGGIFTFGDAAFKGSAGNIALNKPIVGMTATTDGGGYWLVATDGGIFAYGDAAFKGSTGNIILNKPIVGMANSGDDGGYWLVASDGGIFTEGDAPFEGSTGNIALNKPIVGMASLPA